MVDGGSTADPEPPGDRVTRRGVHPRDRPAAAPNSAAASDNGAVGELAQLVERCNRTAEVRGSNPLFSTFEFSGSTLLLGDDQVVEAPDSPAPACAVQASNHCPGTGERLGDGQHFARARPLLSCRDRHTVTAAAKALQPVPETGRARSASRPDKRSLIDGFQAGFDVNPLQDPAPCPQHPMAMNWTSEAEQRLKEVPFFVRPAVRRKIEKLAGEAGLELVDDAFYDQAKASFGQS